MSRYWRLQGIVCLVVVLEGWKVSRQAAEVLDAIERRVSNGRGTVGGYMHETCGGLKTDFARQRRYSGYFGKIRRKHALIPTESHAHTARTGAWLCPRTAWPITGPLPGRWTRKKDRDRSNEDRDWGPKVMMGRGRGPRV
nr:hypothetical protein CFP56_69887 [Quercus suber]